MSHPRSSRVSVATLALTPQVVGGAVAVSERVVRDARFLSNPVFEFDIVFAESALGKDVLARDNPGISPDQANTLDVRGIVKLGSQVRHGDVLVSKLRPTTQSDLTHEEKLLHAIFGNQLGNLRNDSLQYTNLDPGEVVSVQLRAKERGTCNQCGDVNASDGKCPYCGGPFPWVQTDLFDKSAAFMEVVVGVSITRNLALGDVLQDDQGNKVVIAQIIPDEPEARTDMWLHPDSPLAARFKGGEALHTVALTKTTTQVEDKVRARATGPYSLITQMPLGNFCPGQTVTQDTVRALFQAGYRRNLVEMLTIKSDAVDGRGLAYEACLNGEQVPLGVPESTYKLASYLKALCIDMRLSNRQDDVVESVDLDGGANPDGELLLDFAGAAPSDILGWSNGLVKKPETINYRTYRPENDGLFCERIFGPEKDWECACGKFRGMKYKGTICDRCGVKIDRNLVRRRRMGHIDLAAPVVHRWFVSADAGLARLLGLASEDLDNIVYRQDFVVTEPGATDFALHQLLTSEEVDEARARFGADGFKVSTGAEAIRALLGAKHLGQLDWIIVDTLPVLPPDLRPLVLLDNGNFATSDLNDLYRRVVNRNNRLRKLGDLKAPENVIESEKRQLQECVDALFDNENLRRPVLGDSNRPLKSLGEMLAYALEDMGNKRSDYSARGVVIPDATLQVGREIGLPAEVVQTLFKVWALRIAQGVSKATCVKAAAKWLDQEENSPQALDVYRQVLPGRPVLAIADAQRFAGLQPILVEGEAIRLHPDDARALAIGFAGEQLTLHVPLSLAASAELSDPRPQPKISSLLDTLTPNDLVARMATAHDPLHLGPFDRALLGVDRR